MALVMGVDSSTQSCKVVITDAATGAIVREGRAAHPHGTEVHPGGWWSALRAAITDAGGLDDVEAWAIGGQQHGMVVLDAGRPRHPGRAAVERHPIGGRGGRPDRRVRRRGARAAHRARAGGVVHDHQAPLAARPRTRERGACRGRRAARTTGSPGACAASAREGDSARGPVLDELVTDRSDASGTGYWDPAIGRLRPRAARRRARA